MAKIHKGSQTLEVTKGAYRAIYAPLGWSLEASVEPTQAELPEGEENSSTTPPEQPQNDSQQESEDFEAEDEYQDEGTSEELEELSEKPLSEMSFDELKQYASELGLEYIGIRSKRELRALIKSALA